MTEEVSRHLTVITSGESSVTPIARPVAVPEWVGGVLGNDNKVLEV